MCKGPKTTGVGTLEAPGQTVTAENYYPASPGIPSHVPLKSMPEVTLPKAGRGGGIVGSQLGRGWPTDSGKDPFGPWEENRI